MKVVRIVYLFATWLLLAAILLQVLLIGLGLFYDGYRAKYTAAHEGLGWVIGHMFAPLALVVGFFARLGWKLIVVNATTLVLVLVLPVLATGNGLAAGFHPLVAVSVFALIFYMIGKVREMIPAPFGTAPSLAAPSRGPTTSQGRPTSRAAQPGQR